MLSPAVQSFSSLLTRIESSSLLNEVSVIGIAGFSGSGKTTLCRQIVEALPEIAHHLDCDRFSAFSFMERQSRLNDAGKSGNSTLISIEENPRNWYAWDTLELAVRSLRRDRRFAYGRAWNKKTGNLDEDYAINLPPDGPAFVLCDCIYLLHPQVRQWFDVTIFLNTPFELTLDRGLARNSGDERARYMERLHRTYTIPYFNKYSLSADLVYRPRD